MVLVSQHETNEYRCHDPKMLAVCCRLFWLQPACASLLSNSFADSVAMTPTVRKKPAAAEHTVKTKNHKKPAAAERAVNATDTDNMATPTKNKNVPATQKPKETRWVMTDTGLQEIDWTGRSDIDPDDEDNDEADDSSN